MPRRRSEERRIEVITTVHCVLWPLVRLIVCAVLSVAVFRAFEPTWQRDCDWPQKQWVVVMLPAMAASALLRLLHARGAVRGPLACLSIVLPVASLGWSLYGIHVVFVLPCCAASTRQWALGLWLLEFAIATGPKLLLVLLFAAAVCGVLIAGRNGANPWLAAEERARAQTPAPEFLKKELKSVLWRSLTAGPVRQSPPASQRRLSSSQTSVAALGEALKQPIASLHALWEGGGNDDADDEGCCCPICFAEFEANDRVVPLPCDTRHVFHHSCLFTWLATSSTCPVCRRNLVEVVRDAAPPADTPPPPARQPTRWWFRRARQEDPREIV